MSGSGPLAHATGQVPCLLVVDDQPANIQVLYRAFADDHRVIMATSGEQALALAAQQRPDLVLLDVVMPGMDGLEVCRRLKALAPTRDTPVIFVTAQHDEAAETQGLAAGAVDFIAKPINPAIVRARVRTHLTLKAQADLLRQWAYIDGLTGVANRRHFDEQLHREWGRATRNGTALSLLLIDIDHFKSFNDRCGHQAGDEALRRVAAALQYGLRRPGDLLARYGGEEFAALVPETPSAGARAMADHLRAQVAALDIPHPASPVAPRVSVSVGACSRAAGANGSVESLLRGADAQLYAAKAAGRNRVHGALLDAAAPAGT